MKTRLTGILMLSLLTLLACQKKDNPNTLSINPSQVSFPKDGGSALLALQTDADSWNISNPASDWLVVSNTSGTEKNAQISLKIETKTLTARTDTLTIMAGDANPVQVMVSQASSDYLYNLSTSENSFSLKRSGDSATLTVTTDAREWAMSTDADWLQLSKTAGGQGSTSVNMTAPENTGTDARTATLTLTAENAPTVEITVTQKGEIYPSYNTSPQAPDETGMTSTAAELAAKINLGWNLGNSLEATGGETAWGNPKTTKALIDLVKQSGFNAIRIPCSWNQYANAATAEIQADWLQRVKEVVQYCIDDDMYVILNIHWDGGWLENNCTQDKEEEVNARQKAFWEQIATTMRDFDEHLLFASANEPNVDNATQMAVLESYHQTFINAVRSTGGKNSYRVLVIQGPSTDIEKTNQLMTSLPTDEVADRLMVEIHYYTPWNFCGMTEDADWGKMFYYWGNGYHSTTDTERNATWGEEPTVNDFFGLMKQQFVDKGIPVVLGEFSAVRRSDLTGDALTLHLASRAYFLKYVTQKAKEDGILPFYWDNGSMDNNNCAIFNRNDDTVFDQQALDAMVQGANAAQ
ncbi:cellulase family glycosylhydrolase [Prolixibacter denitrificans]|uniref:Aryl-phospho-beta-D-glucosidase BglC (GH1 family) n=2 Tax=Prolixibacter denitrificans TaxID=1541063 RepID=A0A2P8C672_9BACT|nr:cellulase family glycosylhydrolase [Prolixibacter denitrificans]PSK80447.1 aryl-phospho-beta-D-glucosidase BglC (GH1 family) [Prolixibacter denitrificans]